MVRAGGTGGLFDDFKENGYVSIGWGEIGEISKSDTRESLKLKILEKWPDWHPQKIAISAGQLYRFRNEIRKADLVLTYDPSRRVYLVGTAQANYRFDSEWTNDDSANFQSIDWQEEISRDALTVRSKNSLGAISALFKLPDHVADDVQRVMSGSPPPEEAAIEIDDTDDDFSLVTIQNKATEFIKDLLSRISADDMEQLVAGVLRGMGYKTRVSPKGADRGLDVLASPDGLGFEDPRIVVEVKHRINTSIGSQEIRSFLGGRHDRDKGLYVSTGGFTKDAYYEADRAKIPLFLMTLDELAKAILDNYENLDTETKALIPLTRVYWPT